jgi:transcriptional regulator with XRE-family HTH domain
MSNSYAKRAQSKLYDAEVAARLAGARRAAGLTQAALAALVGLSVQQVHKYESGQSRVTAGNLVVYAEALDIPVTALVGTDPGEIALIRSYRAIRNLGIRQRLVDLAEAMAGSEGASDD